MKKGFTLVEIIISISLILLVGISTIFFIFNNKNNKELISITKEILEAANLYANKEVDESGNIYLNEVRNGKKGIKIPLTNLVNKGYIDESLEKQVKELTNEDNYYVMLLDGSDESIDYCNDGSILTLASWIDEDKNKDIYLCNNENILSTTIQDNLINHILSEYNEGEIKEIVKNENLDTTEWKELDSNEGSSVAVYQVKESGLFKFSTTTEYFYRGNVENNYVEINNIIYRIMGFDTSNQKIKLITEKNTNLTIEEYTEDFMSKHPGETYGVLLSTYVGMFPEILTFDYAVYAGIYPEWDAYRYYGNSYLTTGDSTFVLVYNENTEKWYTFNSYSVDCSYVELYNELGGDMECYGDYYNEIRPIIYVNNDGLNFTGKGTITSPYIITPKQ